MLDATLQTQLKAYLEKLQKPIVLAASVDAGAASQQMRTLLGQVAALSPKVSLIERDDGQRTPSFTIGEQAEPPRVRFAGLPMGHEFTSLVLALLQVGGHPPKVEASVIEQIQALDGEFEFETYMSLTCQNCPEVVQALNLMAVLNPRIKHTTIDGALFQEEVAERQIMAVPSVFLNGRPFGQGRMGVEQILAKLDTSSATRDAARLAEKAPYEMLIVEIGRAHV